MTCKKRNKPPKPIKAAHAKKYFKDVIRMARKVGVEDPEIIYRGGTHPVLTCVISGKRRDFRLASTPRHPDQMVKIVSRDVRRAVAA